MTDKQISRNKNLCAIGAFVVVLFLLLFLELFVGNISRVSGNSMYPSLHDGDIVIETKLKEPQKGDIISCTSDILEEDYGRIIKRVVATEGDHIIIRDSQVFINGELVDEPYIHEQSFEGEIDLVIPKGTCFVLGDNRNHSTDSRELGVVRLEDVTGVVFDVCVRKGEYRYEKSANH